MIEKNLLDIFTFILAVWGSLIGTILGVREIRKGRRQLKIVLEYRDFNDIGLLILINTGHRPITITTIMMEAMIDEINEKNETIKVMQTIPANVMFDEQDPFPVTLEDGDDVTVLLGGTITWNLFDPKYRPNIIVFDTEGNKYSKIERRRYNAKWGGLTKMK